MRDTLLDPARVDRRAFAVTSFVEAERADLSCWRSRTADEPMEAWELGRQWSFSITESSRR
jgi:hypothetical protein